MKGFSTHQSARWRHPTRTEFCQTKEEIFIFICFEFDYISIKKTLNHRQFMILTALNLFLLFVLNLNQWGPTLGFNKKKWWFPFQIKNTLSPSMGVGDGVGAGDGDSVNWSRVPRFFPSRDLAMTIWAFSASCSRDFILREKKKTTALQLKYCSRI